MYVCRCWSQGALESYGPRHRRAYAVGHSHPQDATGTYMLPLDIKCMYSGQTNIHSTHYVIFEKNSRCLSPECGTSAK